MRKGTRGHGKLRRRLAVLVVSLLVMDQFLQFTVLQDGMLLLRRIAPFDPPIFHPGQEELFGRLDLFVQNGGLIEEKFNFDVDLGWCPKPEMELGEIHWDWAA